MADPADRKTRAMVLCVGLVACLGVVLAYGIDWVENEVDLGYDEEARRYPYLAASLFLNAQGIESEAVAGLSLLDDLPSVDDTILMSTSRRTLSERRSSDLLAWVQAGGHLIVAAEEVFDFSQGESRDALLDEVEIRLNDPDDFDAGEISGDAEDGAEGESEIDQAEIDQAEGEDTEDLAGLEETDARSSRTLEQLLVELLSGEPGECESDLDRVTPLELDDEGDPLVLELSSSNFLSTADGEGLYAFGESGAQLARVSVGAGVVHAVTSTRIWTSRRIHCHDHAYLLWLMSRGSAKLWMLHDPDVSSLVAMLAANFPLTLVGVAGLFVLWAASSTSRFGPYRLVEVGERRQLLEHLQATADFWWRGALLRAPLEALRKDLRQRAGRELALAPLELEGNAERIAKAARLPLMDVELALTGDPTMKKRDFVKTMQILVTCRRRL